MVWQHGEIKSLIVVTFMSRKNNPNINFADQYPYLSLDSSLYSILRFRVPHILMTCLTNSVLARSFQHQELTLPLSFDSLVSQRVRVMSPLNAFLFHKLYSELIATWNWFLWNNDGMQLFSRLHVKSERGVFCPTIISSSNYVVMRDFLRVHWWSHGPHGDKKSSSSEKFTAWFKCGRWNH